MAIRCTSFGGHFAIFRIDLGSVGLAAEIQRYHWIRTNISIRFHTGLQNGRVQKRVTRECECECECECRKLPTFSSITEMLDASSWHTLHSSLSIILPVHYYLYASSLPLDTIHNYWWITSDTTSLRGRYLERREMWPAHETMVCEKQLWRAFPACSRCDIYFLLERPIVQVPAGCSQRLRHESSLKKQMFCSAICSHRTAEFGFAFIKMGAESKRGSARAL
jgi:hypothetical protein